MSITEQVLRRGDAIILRPQPRVRKPLAEEIRVVVDSGPLTIIEGRSKHGDIIYKFRARSKKYADRDDMGKLVAGLMRYLYGNREKNRLKSRRYWAKHKDERNAKRRKQ